MTKHRVLALFFTLSLVVTTGGCSNRFVSGARRLFIQPVTHSAQYIATRTKDLFSRSAPQAQPAESVEQAYEGVKPVVMIEDQAGKRTPGRTEPSGIDDVVSPEQAAQFREDLVSKPYDAAVRYNMGRLYLQQGLLDEAAYELDMATSLDPKYPSAFILLGRVLRLRHQYDLAVAKFRTAAILQPDLPVAYSEAGICWDQRGFHDRAREEYSKALAITPDDAFLYNNMGYSFFLEGDYGSAIKAYRTALTLRPNERQIHNNIAMSYALEQKWDKALRHFTEALGEAAAQNNLGHLLLRAGKLDEALAHLELAVRMKPDSVRALGNLESALRLKGRIDDAAKFHAQLLDVERAQSQKGPSSDGPTASASFVQEP